MSFEVVTPHSLDEALDALASGENLVPLAGATDLMVCLEAGTLGPCSFLNLQELPQLRPTLSMNGSLTLGALTTYRDVRVSPIREQFPMLAWAAREVGALAIQSRGTWAGNIANASPAADGVPALMAHDAEIDLSSKKERRRVPLAKFYRGYKEMDRRPDEIITAIHLPLPQPGWAGYYRKVGTRRFQAISKTLLAGRILLDADRKVGDIRMVFASVAPYTLRAAQTEAMLRGRHLTPEVIEEAARAIQDEIHPIDDIRSTETYRRRVTSNLVRDFLSGQHPNGPL
ncbi:MAG TPA: FAD binding domain-containing protein [Terriglobia bacterium]|nr:FAD binding domain-containing protein [Terriglobia bacterium]